MPLSKNSNSQQPKGVSSKMQTSKLRVTSNQDQQVQRRASKRQKVRHKKQSKQAIKKYYSSTTVNGFWRQTQHRAAVQNISNANISKLQNQIKEESQQKMAEIQQVGEFSVCVKNISFQADVDDVRDFFEYCGNILSVNLLSREDGRSRGTAFVKFSTRSSMQHALTLNGANYLGKRLIVQPEKLPIVQTQIRSTKDRFSIKHAERKFSDRQRSHQQKNFKASGNKPHELDNSKSNDNAVSAKETATLHIGGLSYSSSQASIRQFFSQCGPINAARVILRRQTGQSRGFGYVEFADVDSSRKALRTLDETYLDGRKMKLSYAKQRQPDKIDKKQEDTTTQIVFKDRVPRNAGNSRVILNQDAKNARKGVIGVFAGKKIAL